MNPYRKRAKQGWDAGKAYKKDSNRRERQYGRREAHKHLRGLPEEKRYDPPRYNRGYSYNDCTEHKEWWEGL